MRTPTPWPLPRSPTTSTELRALGVSRRMIATALERKSLVRLRRDVYLAAECLDCDERSRHLLRAKAEQAANPAYVAGHETAALAWALPFADDAAAIELPVMLLPNGGANRSGVTASARVHRRAVPQHHQDVVDGLRATTPARTAVDLARGRLLPAALIPLDAAARTLSLAVPAVSRRRDLGNPRLHEMARSVLVEAAQVGGLPGDLQRFIQRADPRRESPIESLSAGHIFLAGIPEPIPQAEVVTPRGSLFPDFLWPEHRLIGEADGAAKYQAQHVMLLEKQREQLLRDLGFDVVRWTGKEIWATPAAVMDRIVRALDRNAT